MNYLHEVETKILDTTEAELLPKLQSLGFKPYFKGVLKAQWLVNPYGGEKLRIRQENDIVMVEQKMPAPGSNVNIKSLQETGFEARGFEEIIETLLKVGLEKVGFPSVKRRVSYILDYDNPTEWVRLDFDTYSSLMGKSIPEFLEVEARYEEKVLEIVKALGFQESDCRNFWPKELFQYYYPDEPII